MPHTSKVNKQTSLFRQEAIEGQHKTKLGDALMLPKTRHWLIAILLLLITAVSIYVLITQSYTNKVTVHGWMIATNPSVDIYPYESASQIESLEISQGQYVSAGQLLARVKRSQGALSGDINNDKHQSSLIKQGALLKDRQHILSSQFIEQKKQNSNAIKALEKEFGLVTRKQAKLSSLISHYENKVAKSEKLVLKGLLARSVLRANEAELLTVQLQLDDVFLSAQRLQGQINNTQESLTFNQLQYAEDKAQILSAIEQNKQKLSLFGTTQFYEIKSPIDGVVENIQVKPGASVSISSLLMQISPQDTQLKARLFVPSDHAGFIQLHQNIKLKLNAFPYQKFGMASAQLSSISQHVLLPQHIDKAPFAINQPVFLVEATLQNTAIQANGQSINLKPGMLFQAEVSLSEMKLWEWLLNPIISLRGKW